MACIHWEACNIHTLIVGNLSTPTSVQIPTFTVATQLSTASLTTAAQPSKTQNYLSKNCSGGENTNEPRFWKTIKPFISTKETNHSNTISLREHGNLISEPLPICNIFNEFWAFWFNVTYRAWKNAFVIILQLGGFGENQFQKTKIPHQSKWLSNFQIKNS